MEKRFNDNDNIFINKRENFLMAVTGLSVLYLLGLVIQTSFIITPLRMFISIMLALITFLFNILLGTTGLICSVVWNVLQLLLYFNEYKSFGEDTTLYLIGIVILSMLISMIFSLFMRKISAKISELIEKANSERTKRIRIEESDRTPVEPIRDSLIVSHEEFMDNGYSETLSLSRTASLDPLSTLPNRDRIIEHIDSLIGNVISKSQATPESGDSDVTPITVTYLTIDNSEQFTHKAGHRTIDLFIQSMAHRIREAADSSDMVGRISGTEFVVVTQRLMDENQTKAYISSLCSAATDCFKDEDGNKNITASAGCSVYPKDSRFPGELVIMAESAMHRAFSEGGNRAVFYTAESSGDSYFKNMTNGQIKQTIDDAFSNNEFYMVYQPRFNRSNRLCGFEAFIRWDKTDAQDLLAAADKSGDIYRLGHFSLTEALKTLKEINSINPRLVMTVNLSTVQLRNGQLESDLSDIITDVGCDVNNLILDIPEESLLTGFSEIRNLLEKFSDQGIQMALDNFGRGYSSLNNIPLLPVSTLKLDGNFTKDLNNDRAKKMLTAGIISLLDEIDIPICATGVESKEQYEILTSYNCRFFQGEYLCKPLASDKVADYVRFRSIRE